jgi:hypothetical protein
LERPEAVDRPLLWLNLLLLAPIALVPPAAALVAEYGNLTLAVVTYGANAARRRAGAVGRNRLWVPRTASQ